jgi:hypothetical protein
MRFGLNFFPSFRAEDGTAADYYDQCLRLAARADELGCSSIKTVAFRTLELFTADVMPRFSTV